MLLKCATRRADRFFAACRLRSVGIIIDLKEHFNPNMYYITLNSDGN